MIKTFADKRTEELYVTGKSRRFAPDVVRRALRKLEQLNAAASLNDLRYPPSNRLHALSGTRKGQHSISINDQWRICFVFKDGDAHDVAVCDYH
ncbi:MAG TPA: type II toxin-antitoxin system RelE/ParE family toxin [Planctomycetaceae bacterium]|nr:type II toxin-antitoxin system RelE/ParE family toxin [Planctomycetaceae bacterium]